MGADSTDDFQKELVDLFVQEAHEWLQNIHVALDELQQGPEPERHAKLIETISTGVTNLGGSAATVNLPDVTQASFSAIPLVKALQDPQKASSAQEFLSLCKQLGQIHAALTRATGVSFEQDESSATDDAIYATLTPMKFLQELHELQDKRSAGAESGGTLIGRLIEQMEGQVQAGVERIDITVLQGYLARVSEAEESFLKAIDEHIPEITEKISALIMQRGQTSPSIAALKASLQDVAHLRTEAQHVNAGSAMVFFTGLHSLLTVMFQHRVLLGAVRLESVKARLEVMGGTIRQWGEDGRAQRTAVDQLLLASQS
jgi:chemotaxis protein histidine kinase CheA